MSYQITSEPKGTVKTFYGSITGRELTDSSEKSHGNPHFDDLSYVINDFLGVTEVLVTKHDVEHIAATDSVAVRTNRRIRVAVVATNPMIVAFANQYASSRFANFPFRIFPTMAESRAWLAEQASIVHDSVCGIHHCGDSSDGGG
jgi:hypothetical protein